MGTEDYNNIALSYLPCILQFAKHLNVIFLIISPVRWLTLSSFTDFGNWASEKLSEKVRQLEGEV